MPSGISRLTTPTRLLFRDITSDARFLWDAMAIIRGEKPQQALMKQACSIGHSKSKRRPVGLTPEQAASLNTHPRIKALRKQLSRLRQGSDAYKEKGLEIKREKASLERALLQETKDAWTENQGCRRH